MESPEIDPHKSSQLLLDKGAKAIQWSKVVFSTNGAGTTGHLHVKKKINLDTDITPFTKTNSKLITNQNVKY